MGILDNFISFVLQFNQDTTTTNYLKIIAFSKKVLRKDFKSQKEYELLLQKSKQFQQLCMIARKPKKSLKWADHNQEKPLQQIRFIDIVGKGKNYLEIMIIILFQKIIYKISTNLMLL